MMAPTHCPLHNLNCYDRPTTTPPQATAHGVDPYPGSPNNNNTMSLSSAPVIKGACNYGSPQMQELIYDGRWWVDPYLPDPWLNNPQVAGMGKVWVQVWVRLRVPVGYPCGSLVASICICIYICSTLLCHLFHWESIFPQYYFTLSQQWVPRVFSQASAPHQSFSHVTSHAICTVTELHSTS